MSDKLKSSLNTLEQKLEPLKNQRNAVSEAIVAIADTVKALSDNRLTAVAAESVTSTESKSRAKAPSKRTTAKK